jgi:hypothetical protein
MYTVYVCDFLQLYTIFLGGKPQMFRLVYHLCFKIRAERKKKKEGKKERKKKERRKERKKKERRKKRKEIEYCGYHRHKKTAG